MTKKRFVVKPIEPLILEFEDGKELKAAFTIEALMFMQEEFGNLQTLAKEEIEKPFDLAAKLLYSGMKVYDESVTLDLAESIVLGGGIGLVQVILENVIESFDGANLSEEELKKTVEAMGLEAGIAPSI